MLFWSYKVLICEYSFTKDCIIINLYFIKYNKFDEYYKIASENIIIVSQNAIILS